MKTKATQGRKSIDSVAMQSKEPDLSHPAGRRVRIRELCELHEEITVGEILQDMNRAVEVDRGAILGTLLDLEKAGFIMVLDAEDPLDREVALV